MREIKFRVWNSKKQTMENKSALAFDKAGVVLYDYEQLMQYTGLKDKNGVKIYEGDIVKIGYPYTETNAKIIFNNGQFYPDSKNETIYFRHWAYEAEVIGNIYENEELLK